MRNKSSLFILVSFAAFAALSMRGFAQGPASAGPDYEAIAHKIVNHALEVKPGEVVIISGTPAELELLGALSFAVSMAGGQPAVEVGFPAINKRAIMEMPLEYLNITPSYPPIQYRAADCFIATGSTQDARLFADVPEERLAALRRATMPLGEAFARAHFRNVGLGQTGGIPTRAYAESQGADYEAMLAMFWESVDADYGQMTQTGEALSGVLKHNSMVRLTTEAGTNLTFRISDLPVRLSCGRTSDNLSAYGPASTWLPAGEVYACLDPSSAEGTLVIPTWDFRGNPVKNLKLTFANGRITGLTADQNGGMITKSLEMSTGDKDVLSTVDIGINPNSHPLEGSAYLSWEMAGMVTVVIGNNSWAGGNVVSDNGMVFHVANATLTVDGKNIVRSGRLEPN